MRCRVLKRTVDGVPIGGVVDLTDNLANRHLIKGGVVEPLDPLPAAPPPKSAGDKGRAEFENMRESFDRAWDGAQSRIRDLERQVKHLSDTSVVECGACLPGATSCEYCDGTRLVPAVAEVERLRERLAAVLEAAGQREEATPPSAPQTEAAKPQKAKLSKE